MSGSTQSTFATNDHVRVKLGVTDFDYADVRLGGWTGTVLELEEGGCTTCLVHWSEETLRAMAPRHRIRWEQDGIDEEEKWMDQDDLEMDDCERPPVERRSTTSRCPEQDDLDSQARWQNEGGQ